ncbi:MAG: LysR family transcriptional regulator [Marinomonas atlantica]|nr:LysR family transcriptional regulator [Marinomonas atlantica]
MDIHQLKSFASVANEGSIRRASELLFLSQPAVSAHIKAMEEILGVSLFERTPSGMTLTEDGTRLLPKAQHTLQAHQRFLDEAKQIKHSLSGKLIIGVAANTSSQALGTLVSRLSEHYPDIQMDILHAPSLDIQAGLINGRFDVAFYNEGDIPRPEQNVIQVTQFGVDLVAPTGLLDRSKQQDWCYLAQQTWVIPSPSTCCGKLAEALFQQQGSTPKQLIRVDDEKVLRTLISGGVGVGLLHQDVAQEARLEGEVELIMTVKSAVPVYFTYLKNRALEPIIQVACSSIQ